MRRAWVGLAMTGLTSVVFKQGSDHVSSAVPISYVIQQVSPQMIRVTSECSVRSKGESFKALKRLWVQTGDSWSPGWKLQVLD